MVLLLFVAVPLPMGGYLVYQRLAAEYEEREADRLRREQIQSYTPTPPTTPRPWVERDPPPLELAATRPDASGGLIAYERPDNGGVRVVTPKGEFVAGIDGFDNDYSAGSVRLSRDRTRLAVFVHDYERERAEQDRGNEPPTAGSVLGQGVYGEVLVYDLARPGPPLARLARGQRSDMQVWGGDGNTLYMHRFEWESRKPWQQREIWERVDLATGTATPLTLPPNHVLLDVSPDGKTLLATEYAPSNDGGRITSYLMDATTLERKRPTDTYVALERFSPDGTKVAGFRLPERKGEVVEELVVVTLADGQVTAVKMGDDDTETMWAPIWSPDGTRLAVRRSVLLPGEKRRPPPPPGGLGERPQTRNELTLRKLDGSDPQPFDPAEGMLWFDWR
jgi:hypothetical protein